LTLAPNAQESISHLAHETIREIDGRLQNVESLASSLLEIQHMKVLTDDQMDEYLYNLVCKMPEIESITIAYNPSITESYKTRSIYHLQNQQVVQKRITTDYQYLDWFQLPTVLEKKTWTEPWFDEEGSKQIVISYCVPIFVSGKVIGIFRLDTKLSDLQSMVSPLKIKKGGYAFLISNKGTIITHPVDSLIMDESIFSLSEEADDPQLRKLGRAMIKGDVGFTRITGGSLFKDDWIYHSPLLTNNWSLGVAISNADVMRDLNLILIIQTFISVLAFLAISITVYQRTLHVSKPLKTFADIATRIGKGDFDAELPKVSKTYEIDRLTNAIAAMQTSLKDYIHNLEVTSNEKNRILAEVRIASEIQRNLLPKNTDDPLCNGLIRAYGVLEPAGEIGGDLFDFFTIGDSHFGFTVADVAGKGIVAAMTMTIASTFLRTISDFHLSTSQVLGELNNFLCYHNIEANFVTVLMGIIDLQTGRMEYSNAGHVPMFIRKMDRSYKIYAETHSNPVGVFENMEIGSDAIQLDTGDEIILFTDGITEAMNITEDFLGVSGLEKIVNKLGMPNPQKSTTTILEYVHTYSINAAYKDDITILSIDYKHPSH